EYCGDNHSMMIGKAFAVSQEEFAARLEEAARLEQKVDEGETMAQFGRRVFERGGCESCHTTDGVTKTGPSFKGKYGSTETLVDGSTLVIDDNYIRESVLEPNAKIVQGFVPQMP